MKKILTLIAVSTLVVAACGGDDDSGTADTTVGGGLPTVVVTDAWARTSAMNAEMGAMYATLQASEDDVLTEVRVPMDVAMGTEIHETSMGDDDVMSMREIGRIELGAGEVVVLEPGGLHVMVMGLTEPLTDGDSFTATLVFEAAGEVDVVVEIRDDSM